GTNGFGYDPIFEPENCGKTFAEMEMDEKNSYSHRARAIKKMITFMHDRIQPES
ncbi:MAG: non-canonical purine NTP pyrophosphatase, partial [Crocinitomicaceae bacterium]|nr:non-canonical purine NTP pyrophosphatase [Crocinitomicaceae bacterium]